MNRYVKLGLILLAGASIGAAAVNTLRAQGKIAGAYVIIDINAFTNAEEFKTLIPKLGPANAAFGVKPIVQTETTIGLDGTPPKRLAIIPFDSVDKAKAWTDSAAVKEITGIRTKTTSSRSFIVEGLPN
jgi:uncharacterized protein (DUF1330 family)